MNKYMKKACKEARKAYKEGNVPVGAVIVDKSGSVLSTEHNIKNTSNISIYHAEILAIIVACEELNSWHLDDCTLYVTLKPCTMCEAAIAESRIKKVVYLLDSNYSDNISSNINNIEFTKYDDNYEYEELLSKFFKEIRDSNVSRETLDC